MNTGRPPCHLDGDAAVCHGSWCRHGHSVPHRRHLLQCHHGILSSLSLQLHEVLWIKLKNKARKGLISTDYICPGQSCPGASALHRGGPTLGVLNERLISPQKRCKSLAVAPVMFHCPMFKVDGFCVVDSVGGCIEQKPQTSEVG